MSYDDFWFIDTRVQTVNLRRWLIWFILLFVFVTVGCYFAVKTMYQDIETYPIQGINYTISVSDAEATNVNGYIRGDIKNESQEAFANKYIYFLLYAEDNKLIGTEYLEITNLQPGETKSYELKFKRNNVEKAYIIMTDEIIKEEI